MIASLSKGSDDADKNSLDMWWHSLKPKLCRKSSWSWPLDSSSFFATGGWASHLLAEGQFNILKDNEDGRSNTAAVLWLAGNPVFLTPNRKKIGEKFLYNPKEVFLSSLYF
ncbi:hypothetical protein TNCV_493301 [Trichonephila clavipes]|nr:hypothetical protein TNCV_493301 [Trichonephila clavipes]